MNAYKEEINRLVDTCENERSLWLILRFIQLRLSVE